MGVDAGDVVIALAIAGGGYVVYRNWISPRIAQAREEHQEAIKQEAMKQYAAGVNAKDAGRLQTIIGGAAAGLSIGGPIGAGVGAVGGIVVSAFTGSTDAEVAKAQTSAFNAFVKGWNLGANAATGGSIFGSGGGMYPKGYPLDTANKAARQWCQQWGGNWIPVTGTSKNSDLNKALEIARRLNPSLKG